MKLTNVNITCSKYTQNVTFVLILPKKHNHKFTKVTKYTLSTCYLSKMSINIIISGRNNLNKKRQMTFSNEVICPVFYSCLNSFLYTTHSSKVNL